AFEDGFDLVVIGAAVEHASVEVGAGMIDEAAEEILDQLGLEVAHEADADQVSVDERRAASESYRYHREGLIHRQNEVAGPVDAFAVAEGARETLAEHDAGVLDGVVLVHVEIAPGFDVQIETPMLREKLEHMI